MSKTLLVFLAFLFSTTAFAQDYNAAINKFQIFYNKKQPDNIYKMFAPRVQTALTPEKTKEMVATMHRDLGAIKSHSFIKQDEHFSFYKLDYTKGRLILVIFLDKENKFQNFRYMAYDADYDKLK